MGSSGEFKHILVLRTSAMGDVAMLPHALHSLRVSYPELRITVATQPLFRPFFDGLDVEFLDVNTKAEHHSLIGMWRLARTARQMGVDCVADVHSVLRSRAFRFAMWLSGVRVAHIRKGRCEKRRYISRSGRGLQPLRHSVVRYCDTIRRLGFSMDDPQPPAKRVIANPFGEKRGVWVGVAPFASKKGKTLPLDLAEAVIKHLSLRYERVFVHSGGGDELRFAERMESIAPNITRLFGRVNFRDEIALISNLDCVVSMDSLVQHLASLVATPTVSIWGATAPELGFFGYGADLKGVVGLDMECRPCSVFGAKECKFGDYRCLRTLSVDQILERVEHFVVPSEQQSK